MSPQTPQQNTTPYSTQPTVPDWFVPSTPPPPQPPHEPPKHLNRWRIVIVSSMVILLCAGVVFALVSLRSSSCFNASPYSQLITDINGVNGDTLTTSSIQPNAQLYGHSVYFLEGTTTFDTERSDDPTSFLQSIGSYYKDLGTTAPIAITISTTYAGTDSVDIARARSQYIRDILVKAGASSTIITIAQPTFTQLNASDEGTDDDTADGESVLLVTISTVSSCRSND